MEILVHFVLFLFSALVIWFFAGLLIESINNVATRFHQSGFTVAFFVLGLLTSISEISVMVNSSIDKVPEISAGNLSGASLVILLLIVPLLAIAGNGIQLKNTIQKRNLGVALFAVSLPTLLMLDGEVSVREGLLCLLVYGTLLYLLNRQRAGSLGQVIKAVETDLVDKDRATAKDIAKIAVGALFIFISGHLLVNEAVYFSKVLSIPGSIVGLLVLSIGTNIPELVIAFRSIAKRHKDIAFGDYLGSTVTNTLIFAFLPLFNGKFSVEPTEFMVTSVLMLFGLVAFYVFAKSKNAISRREGVYLLVVYALFFIAQVANFIKFAVE